MLNVVKIKTTDAKQTQQIGASIVLHECEATDTRIPTAPKCALRFI